MPITSLRIADFRNFTETELEPCHQGLNIICGPNGSGKTSLLEAIHFLGLGKSFRCASAARLIRHETPKFAVFAHLQNEAERRIPVGIERHVDGSMRQRLSEQDITSIAELAYLLPLKVIHSQSQNLLEGGPAFRRQYLDWGLFYHNKGFLTAWRQYERVLKHRNALLKMRRPTNELDVWTKELIKYGLELNQLRHDYIRILTPLVQEMAMELLEISNLTLYYDCGWDETIDFGVALSSAAHDEYRLGYTAYGPHRADLIAKISGLPVKHFLSRGQQKLLICAMILAQGALLAKHSNQGLIYLVDDLPSELDAMSRKKLISLLAKQQTQIFITAIEQATISDLIDRGSEVAVKVFHVEHGTIQTA